MKVQEVTEQTEQKYYVQKCRVRFSFDKNKIFFWYPKRGKKKALFWRQQKKNGLMKMEEAVGAAKEGKQEEVGEGEGEGEEEERRTKVLKKEKKKKRNLETQKRKIK